MSTPFLTRGSARRFDAAVFARARGVPLAWLAVFQVKGLGEVYGRDLYHTLALSWLGWAPMPSFDATHPPLYTALIAATLAVFRSPHPLPVLLLQCLLGAGSVLLLRRIGARLIDEKAARLAALWAALDPALVFFAPHLQTETVFVFMELVFFLGLLRVWDEPLSWRLAVLGLWGGLCVLCRSVFGAYPAFLFFAAWRARGFGRALAFCALLGAGWVLPTGLWAARNYMKYGRMVPLSAQMGSTLYEGFTLDREEIRRRPYDMRDEAAALGINDDALKRGAYFRDKTLAIVRDRPLTAAKIVAGKALLYWRPWLYDPYPWRQRLVMGLYNLVLFAFALRGARAAAAARAPWGAVFALFAYLTAAHAVFLTTLRYRLPLEPFLCLLAALGAAPFLWRGREAGHR